MDIKEIQNYIKDNKIRWTNHAFLRLSQRSIAMKDICSAILSGEIIEEYPDDYPSPSCLILGSAEPKQPLHIVCGIHEEELWIITAYRPNIKEWSEDFKNRKE